MYKGRSISVVLPAFNEDLNIRHFINEITELGIVDEIIAVDNNSSDKTKSEILATNAIYHFEPSPGYGSALISGLHKSSSDLIVMVEPDGTFAANDLEKLLAFSSQFDCVFGTRTTQNLIYSGAYMPQWVRLGNVFCAKLIEVFFNGPSLSDVGCTFKLINRKSLNSILPFLTIHGSHFSPAFMILVIRKKIRCIEIPVSYKERVGASKITGGNVPRTIKLGIVMLLYIFRSRLTSSPLKKHKKSDL
jgi:glycosyltransferase involved in cell wall biosynthesis